MLGRKSFLIILSRITSAGLAFIGLFFISRYLGAEIYGTVSYSMALVVTFNVVANLGYDAAHAKRISEGKNLNDCLSTFIVTKLILTGVMVAVVLASLGVWSMVLGNEMGKASLEIIGLFVLFEVFVNISRIALQTFNARVETAKTQLATLMDPLIRVPVVVLISLNRMEAVHLAYAYLLGGAAMAVVALLLLSRDRIKWKKPTLFKNYTVFAAPLATVSIMNALSVNLDKIVLGAFWASAFVGYYQGGLSIMSLLTVVGAAVSTLVFPTFSKMHSEGDLNAVRKTTLEAERYIIMVTLPAIVMVALFPTEVSVILLGGTFAEAGGPMRFLALAMAFNILNGVYLSQINAIDRPSITAKLVFISLVVEIVLLFMLIPETLMGVELMGLAATGAALAYLGNYAARCLGGRVVIFKLTDTKFNPRLLRHLLAGVIDAGGLLLFSLVWPMGSWIDLVIYAGLSIAIFATALYALGELKKKDINYFLKVVNPMEMKNYIIEELGNDKGGE